MHADSPWFRFWPKDWLSDVNVATLSLRAQGAYMRLLCYCWLDGGVPADVDSLARIWGLGEQEATALRSLLEPVFRPHERRQGWWAHPRIERERSEQREESAKARARSEQAARAASARWNPTDSTEGGNAREPTN